MRKKLGGRAATDNLQSSASPLLMPRIRVFRTVAS